MAGLYEGQQDRQDQNRNVEEVGYATFLMHQGVQPEQEPNSQHHVERTTSSKSKSRAGSSKGSIRSYLSKLKVRLNIEKEELLREHELRRQEADIQFQLKMLKNEKSHARLMLESDESDGTEDVDNLNLDIPFTPEIQTRDWTDQHFPKRPIELSLSQRQGERPQPRPLPQVPIRRNPSPLPPPKMKLPPDQTPGHNLPPPPNDQFHQTSRVPTVIQFPPEPSKPQPFLHAQKLSNELPTQPCVSQTVFVKPPNVDIQMDNRLKAETPSWLPDVSRKMVDISNTMSAITLNLKLPPLNIPTFTGEEGTFLNFLCIFEEQIETREFDERRRLQYLIQYTSSHPQEMAKSCITLAADLGYSTAKALLKERYGEPYEVSMTYVKRLTKPNRVGPTDRKGLRAFSDELRICTNALRGTGYLHEINSTDNLRKIVRRLPDWALKRWYNYNDSLRQRGTSPGISHICDFVTTQARIMNDPVFGGLLDGENRQKSGNNNNNRIGLAGTRGQTPRQGNDKDSNSNVSSQGLNPGPSPGLVKCPKCHADHSLFKCPTFKQLSVQDRNKFVKDSGLCFLCFRKGHSSRDCPRTDICGIDGCTRKHARFLHERQRAADAGSSPFTTASTTTDADSPPTPSAPPPPDVKVSACTSVATLPTPSNTKGAGTTRLLPILPVRLTSAETGKTLECYALLDSGSDTTFCLHSILEDLHAPTRVESITLNTLGGTVCREANVADLVVSNVNGGNSLPLPNVYSQASMPIRRSDQDVASAISSWSHFKGVSTDYLHCTHVKLVIGTDAPELLTPLEVRRGPKGAPFAVRTRLGWTILGPVSGAPDPNVSAMSMSVSTEDSDKRLDEQLAAYFRADFADVYDPCRGLSVSDKNALRIMENSICLVDGHYQMRLPWKEGCPNFPNNEVMARRRLESLKRKLFQNPVVRERYATTLEGYISDGYAEKVPADKVRQLTTASNGFCLLVHFAVYHPMKPEKTRVVFDCPAKFGGTSLNDQLLQGPDNNNNMLGVILRFRQGLIAASSDVAAMFHQVRVHPEDCDSLCFLWWPGGDLNLEPAVYRMLVFVFGAICSPSAAVFALQQCARDNPNFDRPTLDTILRDFYVDDCLTSTDDVESMKRRISELCIVLQKGGFRLTKWQTTSDEVLRSIPEGERAPVKPVSLSGHSTDSSTLTRALGIWWDVDRDVFLFVCDLEDKPANRRCILSSICKTFDPTGCISPFVLPAKVILQELNRLHIDWDEPVPEKYAEDWKEWKSSLPLIEKITLPRCYKLPGVVASQGLHHFSDASTVGYGTVTYLRTSYEDGTFSTSFILGKSRVSPLKSITIPRLELTAAALAARVDVTIRRELTIPLVPSVFWTDSISTLGYIKNVNKRYHTFVANRIASIHEASTPSQWRFVGTETNPADIASRGITVKNQGQVSKWIQGPNFLSLSEEFWPVIYDKNSSQNSAPDPEEKPEEHSHGMTTSTEPRPEEAPVGDTASSPLQPLFTYHSNWTRLKRSVAALLRVRLALLHRIRRLPQLDLASPLTPRDLVEAEHEILRHVQSESFREEIKVLSRVSNAEKISTVKRTSSIRKLNPWLHGGLVRVGGRLRHSALDYDSKHPIILPATHPVTGTIIRHCHELSAHSGREYVLSLTRQRYWIIHGNTAVRRCLSQCFDCKRRTAPNCEQKMADLPEDRVTPDQPPFTSVGIDYFGPFYVRCKRSLVKRYGCVFTCLASRAIHLEVAHTLDTDSFLNAFHRFVARRGRPSIVRSDNGTNFRCGQKELFEALSAWNQTKITNKLAEQHIRWIFNVPAASSWGGIWERTIRSVRKILNALTREQVMTDEGLLTLMCQVEGILNHRPLTPASSDPRDLRALTPNDLLMCRPGSALPAGVFSADDNYCRRRWRQVQYLTDLFWRRWTKEYLRTLQSRSKWDSESRNIQKHDIVVVQDDRVSRNCWPLGRVLEIFKSKDGLVRACRVRTANGTVLRPISKLCLVECAD